MAVAACHTTAGAGTAGAAIAAVAAAPMAAEAIIAAAAITGPAPSQPARRSDCFWAPSWRPRRSNSRASTTACSAIAATIRAAGRSSAATAGAIAVRSRRSHVEARRHAERGVSVGRRLEQHAHAAAAIAGQAYQRLVDFSGAGGRRPRLQRGGARLDAETAQEFALLERAIADRAHGFDGAAQGLVIHEGGGGDVSRRGG